MIISLGVDKENIWSFLPPIYLSLSSIRGVALVSDTLESSRAAEGGLSVGIGTKRTDGNERRGSQMGITRTNTVLVSKLSLQNVEKHRDGDWRWRDGDGEFFAIAPGTRPLRKLKTLTLSRHAKLVEEFSGGMVVIASPSPSPSPVTIYIVTSVVSLPYFCSRITPSL